MILILSEEGDISTNNIIDWLMHYNRSFIRINKGEGIEKLNICISNKYKDIKLEYNDCEISLNSISGYWLRRSFFDYTNFTVQNEKISSAILNYLNIEFNKVKEYLHFKFENSSDRVISNYSTFEVNKLKILDMAVDVGLVIPATLVTNSVSELKSFKKSYQNIIAKSINDPFLPVFKGENYIHYTNMVDEHVLYNLENRIFPCIAQPAIEKKYEIRIFYFEGAFFSMAIFSQKNKQTQIDFRKYDWKKPNRTTPYKLPTEIENKIKLLMEKLNLNTGSIDMILSKDGVYHFLEVNPIGQFGMVSHPCNYNLEKRLCDFLIGIK